MTCRKTSGVGFEIDVIIPADDAKTTFRVVSGKTTDYTETGGSGKQIIRHFCPKCHTLMYMTIEAQPGTVFISLGTVDDEEYLTNATPQREIYTRSRLNFNHGWKSEGAEQKQTET